MGIGEYVNRIELTLARDQNLWELVKRVRVVSLQI